MNHVLPLVEATDKSRFGGIVASNGGRHFINGEVVVVDSPTASVADNKILVVPSTSPSYVPLMRKAKALITDHGGMMSHAAIVAREFNFYLALSAPNRPPKSSRLATRSC